MKELVIKLSATKEEDSKLDIDNVLEDVYNVLFNTWGFHTAECKANIYDLENEEDASCNIIPAKFEREKTERGFGRYIFKDTYDSQCSIQKSSITTEDRIWIGIDDLKLYDNVSGKSVNKPPDIDAFTRMHINKEQAKAIVEVLNTFIETGNI